MNSLIEWFNTYPSRVIVTEWALILILYIILLNCKRRKTPKIKRRFVYCENGRKSNVAYVELVSQDVFDNYELYVGYPILDMNNTSIYFSLPK